MTDEVKKESFKVSDFENENELLKKTIVEIDSTSEGKVDIGGRKYTKVVKRLEILRKHLGFNIRVSTEPLTITDDKVIFKAELFILKDSNWLSVATGHAEEIRINNEINKFAAVENAETSAIGRALAALGISGDEYASLDEMVSSLNQKNENQPQQKAKEDKKLATDTQINYIIKLIKETGSDQEAFLKHYNVKKVKDLTPSNANDAIKKLNIKKTKLADSKNENPSVDKEKEDALSVLNENKKASEKESLNNDIIIEDDTPKETDKKDEANNVELVENKVEEESVQEDSKEEKVEENPSKKDLGEDKVEETSSKKSNEDKSSNKKNEEDKVDTTSSNAKKESTDKKNESSSKTKSSSRRKTNASNKGGRKKSQKDVKQEEKKKDDTDLNDDDIITL